MNQLILDMLLIVPSYVSMLVITNPSGSVLGVKLLTRQEQKDRKTKKNVILQHQCKFIKYLRALYIMHNLDVVHQTWVVKILSNLGEQPFYHSSALGSLQDDCLFDDHFLGLLSSCCAFFSVRSVTCTLHLGVALGLYQS